MSELEMKFSVEDQKDVESGICEVLRDRVPTTWCSIVSGMCAGITAPDGDDKPQAFESNLALMRVYENAMIKHYGIDEEDIAIESMKAYKALKKDVDRARKEIAEQQARIQEQLAAAEENEGYDEVVDSENDKNPA